MATYNGDKYLADQLQSFLNQTRHPDELIIVDDNSTDHTPSIIKDFKSSAPFSVLYFQNRNNIGCTATFNRAMTNTTGDIVLLSDQDDYWFSEKLETIETIFKNEPETELLVHDMQIATETLKPTNYSKMDQVRARGLNGLAGSISGCCTAIRKDILSLLLPIPKNFSAHDIWIHKLSSLWDGRKIISYNLQYYRRHSSNTSTGITSSKTKNKKLRIWKDALDTDATISCNERINNLKTIKKHINSKSFNLPKASPHNERLNLAIKNLEKEMNALTLRNSLLQKRRSARIIIGFKLLNQGCYRYFKGGWATLLKDLLKR